MSSIVNPSEHPNIDVLEKLWMDGLRATDIVEWLDKEGLPPVKVTALAKYGQRKWNPKMKLVVEDKNLDEIRELISEIEDSGMTVNKVGFAKRSGWGWEKQDGVNVQVQRDTVAQTFDIIPVATETFERAAIPSIKINSKGASSPFKPTGWGLAISVPDMQIGYHRDQRGGLTTLHDEAAIDVFHQIALYLEETHGIDAIVNQGDNLDFAMFSSHRSAPGYADTTQLTIDRAGTEVAVQRSIAPNADNYWIEGNHEKRITNSIVDRLPSLTGLSKSNSQEPVLSVPYLCRFDEYNVQYIDGYPDGSVWLNDGLQFVHGHLYGSGKGATAAKYLASSAGTSTIYGHIHRQELVHANKQNAGGGYTYFAGSAGCLCRTDGVVPSSSVGIKSTGKQTSKPKTEDWQQGIFVIWYEKNGRDARVEHVLIENGSAIFRGIQFNATVDPNGEPRR